MEVVDYRDDVYDPICYDAAGTRAHMRVWFDVAAMRARGTTHEWAKNQIEAWFSSGKYASRDRAGESYMTAPLMRSCMSLDPKDKDSVMTMSMPRVIYYAPNVSDQLNIPSCLGALRPGEGRRCPHCAAHG